jgi:hypothetical protein
MLVDLFYGHFKAILIGPYIEKEHEDISYPFASSKVDD